MIVPSNLLSIFSKQAGEQDPRDAIITVNAELNFTQEAALPHIEFPPSALVKPNQSFMTTATSFKSNSPGAFNTHVCQLAPGLWRLRVHASFFSNYLDPVGTFAGLNIGSSFFVFLSAPIVFPVATGAYSVAREILLANKDDRVLYISGPGNGVGQTYSLAVTVEGDRIL